MVTELTIEEQQTEAQEVLGWVQDIWPNTFIAGGAPRNWYLGMPAKDIDIYICPTETMNSEEVENLLASLGFVCVRADNSAYEGEDNNISFVFNATLDMPFQFIISRMNDSKEDILNDFLMDISQILVTEWEDEKPVYVFTLAFEHAVQTASISIMREPKSPSEWGYVAKIKGYFKEWTFNNPYEEKKKERIKSGTFEGLFQALYINNPQLTTIAADAFNTQAEWAADLRTADFEPGTLFFPDGDTDE